MDIKIKLTQETLPDYFTIADASNSPYPEPTNTFNFIGRDSDRLVVTVGDSCTWGQDLEVSDEEFRINNVYGRIIADDLGADWLNLALVGSSNFWITEQIESLAKILPNLTYDKIYIICTFTEPGRSFDSHEDRYINYYKWLDENIKGSQDYYNLLKFLNEECVNRIYLALSTFSNVVLRIGTHLLDAIGFDAVKESDRLPETWINLIAKDLNFNRLSTAYIVWPDQCTRLKNVLELQTKLNKTDFLNWMMEILAATESRRPLLRIESHFNNYHPTSRSHRIWANYILESLNGN